MTSAGTYELVAGNDRAEDGLNIYGESESPDYQSSEDPLYAPDNSDLHEEQPLVTQAVITSQSLTFTNSLALVLGLQIGSGIFTAPSQVSQHVQSPAVAVSAWIVGGLLVWTGAASFIELGQAVPRNGGIQEYLQVCFGDFPALLFSWMWVLVIKPCGMAMVSVICVENLCRGLTPTASVPAFVVKAIAMSLFVVIVYINCKGSRMSAWVGNTFLALKLFTLVSVSLLGFGAFVFHQPKMKQNIANDHIVSTEEGLWSIAGSYVTALFGVLFCYGGWETVGFVAGDMRDPVRDLPRVINTAMIIVVIGFAAINTSLYIVLPFASVRDTNTPIVDFADALFGAYGRRFYSVIASICALGALHSNVFSTARVCIAAAERSYLPGVLASKNVPPGVSVSWNNSFKFTSSVLRYLPSALQIFKFSEDAPVAAILFSGLPTILFIFGGTFNGLVKFYGILEYVFFFLAVLGVFRLRRQSSSERAYRTFTANPIIFCCLSASLVLRGILNDLPLGVGIVFMFLAGFFFFRLRYPAR